MNEADKLKYIVFYGITVYAIIVPIMVWRLIKFEAGIKIAGRNINNLRYVDDTTLWQKVKKN